MGKKKTTQTQQQQQSNNFSNTNTYGQVQDTADISAFREWRPQIDPSIGYNFAGQKNSLVNSFANPLGGMYSPQIRDQILRASLSDLGQRQAQATSAAQSDVNSQRGTQLGALAGMTAPRLLGSSGTSSGTSSGSGTTTQSGGLMGDLLLAAVSGTSSNAGLM